VLQRLNDCTKGVKLTVFVQNILVFVRILSK
jgi:hypothetical protein